jgi:hypothetical protein
MWQGSYTYTFGGAPAGCYHRTESKTVWVNRDPAQVGNGADDISHPLCYRSASVVPLIFVCLGRSTVCWWGGTKWHEVARGGTKWRGATHHLECALHLPCYNFVGRSKRHH